MADYKVKPGHVTFYKGAIRGEGYICDITPKPKEAPSWGTLVTQESAKQKAARLKAEKEAKEKAQAEAKAQAGDLDTVTFADAGTTEL